MRLCSTRYHGYDNQACGWTKGTPATVLSSGGCTLQKAPPGPPLSRHFRITAAPLLYTLLRFWGGACSASCVQMNKSKEQGASLKFRKGHSGLHPPLQWSALEGGDGTEWVCSEYSFSKCILELLKYGKFYLDKSLHCLRARCQVKLSRFPHHPGHSAARQLRDRTVPGMPLPSPGTQLQQMHSRVHPPLLNLNWGL